jgi:hypothetical protein
MKYPAMTAYGKLRNSSTILSPVSRWRLKVSFHALAALPPEKQPPIPIVVEAGWIPKAVYMLCRG